jgi:hypothetical protein
MPQTRIDTADAIELAETLQLIARWLAADPATLTPSFLAYIGHPAYGLDALPTTRSAVTSHEQKQPARPPSAVRTREQPRSKLANETTRRYARWW